MRTDRKKVGLMTTWDIDTVHRVKRFHARVHVDPIVLAQHPGDVAEGVRRKAALQIVEEARALAVEVHPDDVAAVELERGEDEPEYAPVRFEMYWRPGWRDAGVEVELRGGQRDGETMTLRHDLLHYGLWVALSEPPRVALTEEAAVLREPMPRTEHYQLAGWRETERRWVLACE